MSRAPRPGAPRGSLAWRARVSEGVRLAQERQRARERVLPADLRAALQSGAVRPSLRAWVELEADALLAYEAALDGAQLAPWKWHALHSAARLGVVESELSLRFAQAPDPELATKIASVAAQRSRLLERVGIDRAERPVPDARTYAAQREAEKREAATSGAPAEHPEAEAPTDHDRPGASRTAARPGEQEDRSA